MAYNLQSWQNTFANPTSNINRGVLGSAFNTNPLTARGMNILGSNIAYGLPLAYASMASKLQRNLPKSLTGEGGLADQNPYFGGMGVAVEPGVEETLRYGDAVTGTNYPGANRPLNTLDPNWQNELAGYGSTMDRGNIDNRFSFNPLNWGIAGMMKKAFQRTPEKQAAYEAIMGSRDDQGWGTYKGNQYNIQDGKVYSEVNPYGKNFDSMFGSKSLEEMDEKTLAWAEDRLSRGKAISTRLRNILQNRGRLTPQGTDRIGGDITPTPFDPSQGGTTTGGGYTGPPTRDFNPAQFARAGRRPDKPGGFTDPGKGSYGPWKAQGGRVGLYAGGDPEEPAEDVREIMRGENIPFSDQVEGEEGILEQLIAQYIEAGFPPDQAEAMAMQELQAMSQGSEQGIASLV